MTVEEIRKLKKKYGYSNAALSNASGVPLGTVNKVLSGATESPRHDTLKALSAPLLAEMARDREREDPRPPISIEYKYLHAPADSLLREEAAVYGLSTDKGPGDFTITDYYALPDDHRVELIDGVFYDLAAPSTVHQQIALAVAFTITDFIRRKKGKCKPFMAPLDVQLDPADERTMVQPDVLVVCDPSKVHHQRIIGAPDFILEVISPSTSARDYYKKSQKYFSTGVREYWIMDPLRRRLTIYDFEKMEPVRVLPLEGKIGLGIYNGEAEIDLDEIASLL